MKKQYYIVVENSLITDKNAKFDFMPLILDLKDDEVYIIKEYFKTKLFSENQKDTIETMANLYNYLLLKS